MKLFSKSLPELLQMARGNGAGSQLARNGIGSLALKVSDTLFSFLVAVTLARALGADGYGDYSYVYALVSVLAIPAQFGLPNLLVRETAKALAKQEWGLIQGVWRWAGKMTSLLAVILILGTGAVAIVWGKSFNPGQLSAMFWGLILMPLIAFGELRGAALRGLHRVVEGQIPEQAILPGLFFTFVLAAAIVFPKLDMTPATAMALQVAAAGIAFAIGAWLLWRATPTEVRDASPLYEGRAWLASTLPLAFIGGMQLINRRLSILILGIFVDSSQVGIFRVADQMALLINVGLQAMNLAIAPQFAHLYAIGNKERLQKLVTASSRIVFFLTFIVVTFLMLFGKPFLRIVFGEEFAPAYVPLVILAIGQLVNALTGSVAVLLNMTGHEQATAQGMTISAIANVVLNLILVPLWGSNGAALASAVTFTTWNIILWIAVHKKLQINSMAFDLFGWDATTKETD